MKFQSIPLRVLAVTILCLLLAWQARAAQKLQQPQSVASEAFVTTATTELAPLVTPVGCCEESGCPDNKHDCKGEGNCRCKAVCCLKKVTEEVKKHYWTVKPELVCIPSFRFECNWGKSKCGKNEGCCDCGDTCCSSGECRGNDPGKPTCGRVRCINVLEKHEYTCEECGYEWEAKCVRTGSGRCCPTRGCNCPKCGKSNCCAAADDGSSDVQLTSATEGARGTAD